MKHLSLVLAVSTALSNLEIGRAVVRREAR